jgi:hypothetical protein
MIKELSDLPAGVVGFEATGTLKAEDYRDVVLPALEQAFASGEVRFVIVMPEYHGMSGGAVWQDLRWASSISGPGSASPWSPTSTGCAI